MEDPIAALEKAVAEVRATWEAAQAPTHAGSRAGTRAKVDSMGDTGLVALNQTIVAVKRHLDALHAPVAAEMASRSAATRGSEGLARKNGHRSAVKMIAAATGGHPGDAARLIQVGEATSGRMTLTGERTAPKRPHIAVALEAGHLSVAAGAAIVTLLDRLALRVDPITIEEAEQTLVAQARILSLQDLNRVLARAEAFLDPDGLEPKIDQLHTDRLFSMREDSSGAFVFGGKCDPATGAPIKAAIEAIVTHQLRTSRGHNAPSDGDLSADGGGSVGPAVPETRSVAQMQLDALAMICRHMLGCDSDDLPLASTTVIVRMTLDALTTGVGVATIDGVAQPIDAGTARRMAAGANIIPAVLGGDSEVLDWGRAKRLFTTSQRLAACERDGGCSSCGLPPGMTEAHHLEWWELQYGSTDLCNCILLCTTCHHRVHSDGWEIRIDPPPSGDPSGGTVWFIPPAHVDPDRTPRLGGRKRFDYTHNKLDFGRAA